MEGSDPTINESVDRLWKALTLGLPHDVPLGAGIADDHIIKDAMIAALAASSQQELIVPALDMMALAAEHLGDAEARRAWARRLDDRRETR